MARRFFIAGPLRPGPLEVAGPEAHHLAAVSRLRPGDPVRLFNGDGHEYRARVAEVSRRRVALEVLAVESPHREVGYSLEVAAPLPKGDRGQFLLEKLTELGVTRYVPLRTRRSVVHPGEVRREKLERYVIEAAKQCGRNVLLQVEPVIDWDTYCAREGLPGVKLVAHPPSGAGDLGEAAPGPPLAEGVALAVGPEGGLTEEELAAARGAGWRPVGLGPRTLRVETAALVLAAWAGATIPVNP
jgi:16S rRNA (uracil1498-N3)-methyltransferase